MTIGAIVFYKRLMKGILRFLNNNALINDQ